MTDRATEVEAEHRRRLAAIDRAVNLPALDLAGDHVLLTSHDGEAVAVVSPQHTEPDSYSGLWVETDVHRVQLRCSSDADPAGLADLLARAGAARGEPRQAHLLAASRDTLLSRPLSRAGYTPATVLALHRLGAPTADEPATAATIREATPDDVEVLVAAGVAVQAHDSMVGALPDRPLAADVFRPETESALRDHPGWAWVAERDGAVVGVCEMEPPESATWVTGSVSPPTDGSTTAYLGMLHVAPDQRGHGVGAGLVRAAHARAAEAGASQVVLHHAAANPLSVPFWGRAGYRPLLTGWVRHTR